MRTILNGDPRTFDIQPDETALEVIREHAGLTDTNLVCGTGVCGACTVLLNGTPVCSCLILRAERPRDLQNRLRVGHVAGIDAREHPISAVSREA